jgi:hypothetical protein
MEEEDFMHTNNNNKNRNDCLILLLLLLQEEENVPTRRSTSRASWRGLDLTRLTVMMDCVVPTIRDYYFGCGGGGSYYFHNYFDWMGLDGRQKVIGRIHQLLFLPKTCLSPFFFSLS